MTTPLRKSEGSGSSRYTFCAYGHIVGREVCSHGYWYAYTKIISREQNIYARVSYRGRGAPGFPPPPPEIVTILYDYDAM